MSTALRIAHGSFGRVALLDMDASLVRHAHPHCHVLLKVEGADTQFLVGDTVSLADVSLLAYTRLAHEGGFHLDGYAALRRWIGETEKVLGLAPAR